ncbi:MAG: S-layer homology domain-containing protein, partial [Oscillospiraceae bacterium]|nr:S-layer homology domain-containing protein [Oscillospiraceae bacterium]
MTSVIIPASVTSIGKSAFGWHWNDETGNDRIKNFTIYGIAGTAAEEYAKNGGFKFIPLDPQSGFCDVDSNEFYYDAMLWAVQKSVTNGTSQVEFSPADFCTRAQTVTFLWRANGRIAATNPSNPFVDVASGK